jgi:hypothetical protein
MRRKLAFLSTVLLAVGGLLAALLLTAATLPATSAAQGLTLGFNPDPALTDSSSSQATWISRANSEGAGMVRVGITWRDVAPGTRPHGFRPQDPNSPGYNWAPIDASVRALSARGMQVLLSINDAPSWAEGSHRPRAVQEGSWRPNASQFGKFAAAAASRYDGRFPDPLNPGASLPRVRYWQAWNEPNLDVYLSPQWTRTSSGWAASSPIIYRSLLNAFYAGVKQADRTNFVVSAGTAPYGDLPGTDPVGNERMQPVAFDRVLFCLSGRGLKPTNCPDPVHLDALSHHPYAVAGPLQHAFNADDAAVPDIYKLARVLRAAERTGRVLPRGPKRLWVTEISWDSSPPDPQGVPINQQARWLEQALYVLWRQNVDTVLWLQIVDSPPVPSYSTTYQAGLYYLNGGAKPAAQAFRFPFVTRRLDRARVQAWGRAPLTGQLQIQVLRGRQWVPLGRLQVTQRQVFVSTLAVRGAATLRAVVGAQTSLSWSQSG